MSQGMWIHLKSDNLQTYKYTLKYCQPLVCEIVFTNLKIEVAQLVRRKVLELLVTQKNCIYHFTSMYQIQIQTLIKIICWNMHLLYINTFVWVFSDILINWDPIWKSNCNRNSQVSSSILHSCVVIYWSVSLHALIYIDDTTIKNKKKYIQIHF